MLHQFLCLTLLDINDTKKKKRHQITCYFPTKAFQQLHEFGWLEPLELLLFVNNDDTSFELKEESGIWEMRDQSTSAQEMSDNCAWLFQQTQRRLDAERGNNGRGLQSINGSSQTLFAHCCCFAPTNRTHLSHVHMMRCLHGLLTSK